MPEFDPHIFIDRAFEQELFKELLSLKDDTRILTISESAGMGKTSLLKQFQYLCRMSKPVIAAALVSLDRWSSEDPLYLVKKIARELEALGLEFPTFDKLEGARLVSDFSPFLAFESASDVKMSKEDGSKVEVKVDTRTASFLHALPSAKVDISKVEINMDTININQFVGWTPEMYAIARNACVNAFFDELRVQCADRTVVLMLDDYDRCSNEIKRWIEDFMLTRYFFDLANRPARLLLVVAGREAPDFHSRWPATEVDAVVRSVHSMGRWGDRDVKQFLEARGLSVEPKDVNALYAMAQTGLPISSLVQIVELLYKRDDTKQITIGREQDFAEFDALLSERRPALVTVAGETGAGRTNLLRAFQVTASQKEWNVVPNKSWDYLRIAPETDEKKFGRQLRKLLKLTSDAPVVEDSIRAVSKTRSRNNPIVEQLSQKAPVVLLIDGFQPNKEFARWFTEFFLAEIKRSRKLVIIVVNDRTPEMEDLIRHSDRNFSTDMQDAGLIRRKLESLGREITPPMEAAELEEYIKEAQTRLEILDSLTRVLELTRNAVR